MIFFGDYIENFTIALDVTEVLTNTTKPERGMTWVNQEVYSIFNSAVVYILPALVRHLGELLLLEPQE